MQLVQWLFSTTQLAPRWLGWSCLWSQKATLIFPQVSFAWPPSMWVYFARSVCSSCRCRELRLLKPRYDSSIGMPLHSDHLHISVSWMRYHCNVLFMCTLSYFVCFFQGKSKKANTDDRDHSFTSRISVNTSRISVSVQSSPTDSPREWALICIASW